MLTLFPTWLIHLTENILLIVQGLPMSLLLTLGSFILAFNLAMFMTLILYTFRCRFVHYLIKSYILIFTGTPLLMQLFLIYYGVPQFKLFQFSPFLWDLFKHPWFCAMLALTLNSAAYTTELFSGAIKAIPSGQWQSCVALGLSRWHSVRLMFSYGLRRVIPTYSNEVILIFKGSALASTITLMDMMGYTEQIFSQSYTIITLIAAGILYLSINAVFTSIFNYLESICLSFERG